MIECRHTSAAKVILALTALLCFLVPGISHAQRVARKPARPVQSPAKKYIEQAAAAMDKRQYSRAVRFLTRGIAKDKSSAEAYKLRGDAYRKLGILHKAAKDFGRYIELRPSDVNGYLLRADAYNFGYNHKAAMADYNAAIRLKPTSVEAYIGRGLAYAGLERYTEAIKDYQWALQLDPGNREALSNAGRACMLSGRPLAAMTYLKMALERERDPRWKLRIKTWMSKLLEETDKAKKAQRGPTRRRPPTPLKPLW